MKVWLMDAFTDKSFCGNPAGVVPEAAGLSDTEMQAIANELHASETAFVLPATAPDADLKIRYFTPTCEVDLCGHATIATICGLLQNGYFVDQTEGICRAETNVGVLPISYRMLGNVAWAEMGQAPPQFREASLDLERLAWLLGMTVDDLDLSLPLGMCSTGLWDLFVPLKSLDKMETLSPMMGALAEWTTDIGVASTHLYTCETVYRSNHYHARDFSPALGIPEDPATGTATGALVALLHRHGLAEEGTLYRFEQGFEIRRPSLLTARVERTDAGPAVYVSGTAVCSLSGVIHP